MRELLAWHSQVFTVTRPSPQWAKPLNTTAPSAFCASTRADAHTRAKHHFFIQFSHASKGILYSNQFRSLWICADRILRQPVTACYGMRKIKGNSEIRRKWWDRASWPGTAA